jgi:hypothetical protein
MRELATLIVVVLLVYLFQCLCWAPAAAHVFSLETSGTTSRKKHGFLWSALKVAGYWANPLPPLQPLVVVSWPRVQPEPEIVRLLPMDADAIAVAWDQFTVTRSGTKLFCNDLIVLQAGANQLKLQQEFLEKLKRAKTKDRRKLIEAWLRKAMNVAAIEERLKLFSYKSRWLETAVHLQFFLLFMLVPLAFFRFGSRALWPMLAAVITTSLFISWQFLRLHKLFFSGDNETRFKSLLSTVLSPIYAIRAMDALARDLLAGFHPLAVAAVVWSQQEFKAFAGEQLRANKFTVSGANWYGDQFQFVAAQMLAKKGVAQQEVLGPPERDGSCVLYCPRCHAQYLKMRESCADCGHAELLEFTDPPATLKIAAASRKQRNIDGSSKLH